MMSNIIIITILFTGFIPIINSVDGVSAESGSGRGGRDSDDDTDRDGTYDDEDILDDGNAILVVSFDYMNIDDSADVGTSADPYVMIWIDGNGNLEIDEDDGELWTSSFLDDVDVVDDEGYEDRGIFWHAFDIDENASMIWVEFLIYDDDYDDDDLIDINKNSDDYTQANYFTIDHDGPLVERYSDDGNDDGLSEDDAYVEFSFHIIKGPSVESQSPSPLFNFILEGDLLTLSFDNLFLPDFLDEEQVYYFWVLFYLEDTDNYYWLNNDTVYQQDYHELYATFGSAGEYIIYGLLGVYWEEHDCFFWDYTSWLLFITHHNTVPEAQITVDNEVIEQFDTVAFSGFLSSDVDGDELDYQWDFGDGSTASGSDVMHTYTTSGIYTATLNVTDDEGAYDEETIEIVVNALDLSSADKWTDLEDGLTFTIITDYFAYDESRVSGTKTIPLIFGYQLGVTVSLVSELYVYHFGNVSYRCSIEEGEELVTIGNELLYKDDYYVVYYRPRLEFNITYSNVDGNQHTLWHTKVPIPIQTNWEGLDADDQPLLNIPVFDSGLEDLYTWDLLRKIYESSEPLENATGMQYLGKDTIPMVYFDILKYLEIFTGIVPQVKFGIQVLDYFVNMYLRANLNVEISIGEEIGLLTRTTGIVDEEEDFKFYDFVTPYQDIQVSGKDSETKMYVIMNAMAEASLSASIDFYFNLTETGQLIYGLWVSSGEKGLLTTIYDAFVGIFTGGTIVHKDYSFNKVLWESEELQMHEYEELYHTDYLEYSYEYVNLPPVLSQTLPGQNSDEVVLNPTIQWEGDDPEDESLTYSLYFGTSLSELKLVVENVSSNVYSPSLNYSTDYFWKILVSDGYNIIESEILMFTTIDEPVIENQRPSALISSLTEGAKLGQAVHKLRGTASDSDGDIQLVDISIDGSSWVIVTGTDDWYYDWDATTLEGNYTLSVRAFDGEDHSEIATINVSVMDSTAPVDDPTDNPADDDSSMVSMMGTLLMVGAVAIMTRRRNS